MGYRRHSTASVCLAACAVFLSLLDIAVQAQTFAPLPLDKAAAATELPVAVWGPYSQKHHGPCYLANRAAGQLFAFPIVVGQQREEIMLRSVKMPEGNTRLRPTRVTLER